MAGDADPFASPRAESAAIRLPDDEANSGSIGSLATASGASGLLVLAVAAVVAK
jgi:hypothetical protein